MKTLYYGDNLEVLRASIADESVDLIYLDPPFNSQAGYNILFKSPKGEDSQAQITAFEDTWQWGEESVRALEQLKFKRGELAELLDLLVRTLGQNSLSAYLVMMAIRLVELHRVLKSTGSLYLHCDPTASHYLKMILDLIFEPKNFRNEIIWKRQSAHSDAKIRFSNISDTILFYAKSQDTKFQVNFIAHDSNYIKRFNLDDNDGKGLYQTHDMTAPEGGGMAAINKETGKPNGWYEWMNFPPPPRGWRYKLDTMQRLDEEGKIWYPKHADGSFDFSKRPRLKKYLSEHEGAVTTNIWTDIPPINSQAKERLGYPTQKPLALLERIIQASSNPGDLVLDPFCGCGTAVHAAEKLGRNWIGIDITHLAISLIEKRLKDAFPGIEFTVEGTPQDLAAAQDLAQRDKYQFQWWACSLVNAQPYKGKRKGADGGIDGQIFFTDFVNGKPEIRKIIVSVKGGENVSLTMLKDLIATVASNKAELGLFITLANPTKPMLKEAANAGFYQAGNGKAYPKIQVLTIAGLLDGSQRAEYFDLTMGSLNFKKATIEDTGLASQPSLF
ncbi:DNA methyltransferase [Thermosynechococcaceae cyanobacterium BACA0444]|uniref:DNA methyltransferase n=1 Tax=Pseudocalidococcus azoricus BACA0444 TaxID=2918990 RepID=A0AAE4FSG0_9CYAN|nr:DNA methyltransferase [Pseudocalidococcus azoricus]MDS3860106.1 DNA methyltransferase [Pseudocalidococcus azoricus BACA0444]